MKRDACARLARREVGDCEKYLDRRIEDLRLKRGVSGLPSRWRYIRQANSARLPSPLEDKVIQRATTAVLSVISDEDFVGFAYGFRAKRGQLRLGLVMSRKLIIGRSKNPQFESRHRR
jgi:hypothetical protein